VTDAPAPNLVRLHIGLEDVEDLIADLAVALDQAGRSP
jgi:cystathionine beta-lyase/cystathionine gamma-synthase